MKITSANITGSFIINGTDVTNTLTTLNTFSSSINTRTTNLEVTSSALTSSLNALSASVYTTSGSVSSTVVSYGTRIGNLETTGSALSGSILSVSSSLYTTSGSLGTRIGTIESKYATTGSNTFSGNQTITGTITAQTLIVQTVTSSVVYSSGSNTFGNSSGNTQTMYGAVNVIGSVSASAYTGAGTGLTSIPNSALTNNSITVNGVSVALGGTLTQGQVLNGAISGSGQVAIASTSGFGTYINQALLTTSSPTFAAVSATTFTGALSGNATTATTAGALTSMNISQFTNNSGYITGITSANVTTALGFTPYNATNPAGYITGVTNITGNAGTVTNATFYRQFTVRDDRSDGNDYSLSARATGLYAITSTGTNGPGSPYLSLIHVSNATDVAFQIAGGYTSDNMYFRGTSALQNGTGYTAWRTVIHSGNIGSQTVASAGNATTAGGLAVATGRNNSANQIVRTDANGYIQAGYINSSNGNEGNNSSPSRVWGTNGSDDYLRTYLTSALSVSYASSAGSAPANGGTATYSTYLNPLSGDGNYKLAYTADGARTNAGEWGRAVMYYVPNGQTYGIRVDRADYANSAGSISGQANSATINATSGNSGNQIVLRDGSGNIAIGTLNTNYAYFGGGGRGLTAPDTYGSYGNIMTYGTGMNGWYGYGIYDNSGYLSYFMSNGGNFGIYGQSIGKWAFYYSNSTASYSIGSDSPVPGYTLYLIYGLYTVGLYNASDARMKKDIAPLSNSLDKIKLLRGVSYEYIDKGEDGTKNKGVELGFIAQEVLPVIPELIRYDDKKGYAMNYNGVSAVLVEAIKEQQIQIENQQNQINTLISQLTELLNK